MSINEIDEIDLIPYIEVLSDSYNSLCDYMNDPLLFIVNKDQIDISYNKLLEDINKFTGSEEQFDDMTLVILNKHD